MTSASKKKAAPRRSVRRLTARLELRYLEPSDYEVWREALASMEQKKNRWDAGPREPYQLKCAEFTKFIGKQKASRDEDKWYDFGIFLKDSGELIGGVAIMDISRMIFQNAYIGYRIFNRHWRKGYGKEACQAAIDIAFKELRLHRLEAGIAPGNLRSIRLAKSLGFRKEGLSRRRLYLEEKWQDLLIYAVTCDELGYKWRG
jgi:[ribosomal protein S5]-alanine N-acetyltransferase